MSRGTTVLLALCLLCASARAAEVEVRVGNGFSAPKALGTAAQPLRVMTGGAESIPQLPAGVDVRTVDGTFRGLQLPVELLKRQAAPDNVIAAPFGAQAALSEPRASFSAAAGGQTTTAPAQPQGERVSSPHAELDAAAKPENAGAPEVSDPGAVVFDGGAETAQAAPTAPLSRLGRIIGAAGLRLGRAARRVLPKSARERLFAGKVRDTDEYGGPKTLQLDFKGKLAYGAKWGLNMIGLGAALHYAAWAFEKVFTWQLHVSDSLLAATGRVELLARLGPKAIESALIKSPFHFLFVQLPVATAWEEVTGRLLGFGVLWTFLAAVKPAATAAAKWLDSVPDLFGLRRAVQAALGVAAKVSQGAFPIAASLSAVNFAASHFAAWGVNPYFASVHLAMGFSLAYIAYKTRSLLVPVVAHYTYNLLTLAAGLLAVHYFMPVAGALYTSLLGLSCAAFVYFNWRSHQKARSQAKAQALADRLARAARAALPVVLAVLMAGSALGPASLRDHRADQAAVASAVKLWPAQDAAKPSDQAPAAPDTAAQPKRVDLATAIDLMTVSLTAKAKPAVLKIFSGLGLGSGYIVSPDGMVISNAHVVGDAEPGDVLRLEFSDGSEGRIKVVAVNHDKDIAILQLDKNADGAWPFLPVGDSQALAEGQTVLAMGYPLGLPFTVTRGIISDLGGGRGSIYVQQLQTDAAINHGNSGGALINMQGEVVGMNTAIAAPTANSGSIGIGFSIVSEDIKAAIAQYKATGDINTAGLGIIVDQGNPSKPDQGVLIEKVRPGGPAALAGLRDGDLILGIDQRLLPKGARGLELLARVLAHHKPGDKLVLMAARQGDSTPYTVTLGAAK